MKPTFRRAAPLLAALVLSSSGAMAAPRNLKIDKEHSSVTFRVRHIFTKVTGRFREFSGTIAFDETNQAASKVTALIQAATIDTNVEARDKDLRSKRFFDVERFPTLEFASLRLDGASGGRARIVGNLTMHGVTREVVLDTEYLGKGKDPWGNERYGFHAEAKINRKDFGMTWNEVLEAGGVLVGDEVEIILDVEAIPASP